MARTGHFPLQHPVFASLVFPQITIATVTTAAAVTYTADQLLGGFILRDPNGSARTDVLPTAAALVEAIPGALVGTAFGFRIKNTADASEVITMASGSGGTDSGTLTIAQNASTAYQVILTNVTQGSEAYTLYNMGTFTS